MGDYNMYSPDCLIVPDDAGMIDITQSILGGSHTINADSTYDNTINSTATLSLKNLKDLEATLRYDSTKARFWYVDGGSTDSDYINTTTVTYSGCIYGTSGTPIRNNGSGTVKLNSSSPADMPKFKKGDVVATPYTGYSTHDWSPIRQNWEFQPYENYRVEHVQTSGNSYFLRVVGTQPGKEGDLGHMLIAYINSVDNYFELVAPQKKVNNPSNSYFPLLSNV